MRDFGTAANPLRASRLADAMGCTCRAVMEASADRDSGKAADTGSAVHKAAWAMHEGGDFAVSVEVMRASAEEYPLADLAEAARLFRRYYDDPRNRVPLQLNEAQVEVRLPAAPGDPTGEEIVIQGTVDQVRDGVVHDIKTGAALAGWEMALEHSVQMAVYMVGAEARLGTPVHGARIIRVRDYEKGGPVFWDVAIGRRQALRLLSRVPAMVAVVRRGEAWATPGHCCKYCPARSPDRCLEEMK